MFLLCLFVHLLWLSVLTCSPGLRARVVSGFRGGAFLSLTANIKDRESGGLRSAQLLRRDGVLQSTL